MPENVKVEDFEAFRMLRIALLKFAQATEQSLSNADSHIGSTHSWLEGEQTSFWQNQLRKRMEAATDAQNALRQKKLYKDASGKTPNAAVEEKALAKCLAAVREAQEKIEAVRKAIPKLEKETELYRAGVARLSATVLGDIPRAVALLDRLAESLEQYMQIEAPDVNVPDTAPASMFDGTPARGGEAEEQGGTMSQESPGVIAAPANRTEETSTREGSNVSDGQ